MVMKKLSTFDAELSRRTFLTLAAGSLLPWPAFGKSRAKELAQGAGVQLYTVRQALEEKPAETLKALADIGFRHVEHFNLGVLDEHAALAADAGLKITGTHVPSAVVTKPTPELGIETAIDAARRHGFRFVIVAWLPPEERKEWTKLADQLNAAGEKCRAADLQLCYHNHAFEFIPEGETIPFDILLQNLDPDLVQFELDVFWATVAGHDPAELMRRLGKRCRLLHLKDLRDGIERSPSASPPPEAFEELGDGVVDFPAIFETAAEIGVTYGYVEQDHAPGDPLESLRRSMRYLQSFSA